MLGNGLQRQFRLYVWVWLVVCFLPATIYQAVHTDLFFRLMLPVFVEETHYLLNLRDSEIACTTLAARSPRVLVIGDSHSYAAWDFVMLERQLGERVGSCALGGLYIESLPLMLDMVVSSMDVPDVIVLGTSPRMFWESPTKESQRQVHEKLIRNLSVDIQPLIKYKLSGAALPYDSEPEAIAKHADRIEALSEDVIRRRLDQSRNTIFSLRDWDRRLADIIYAPNSSNVVGEICNKATKMGTKILVIHIPESPYLEQMYPPGSWERYLSMLELFHQCAEKIVVNRSGEYGLGNRHYVNRQLRDDIQYQEWYQSGALHDEKDRYFDTDHLNPVGARKFTAIASKLLISPD